VLLIQVVVCDRSIHLRSVTRMKEEPVTQYMNWGGRLLDDGSVRFRLWAPAHERVAVDCDGQERELVRQAEGWHELITRSARAGSRYRFRLSDGTVVPDPASCFQPEDVEGPSEIIDHRSFRWKHPEWNGRPWHSAVVYELHVGTFTQEGTFAAAMERLPYLAALGITAVQLMPVGDFPGRRNWGYDGVLPYAPDSTYGRPDELRRLIDAAHGLGLMVLLDVVYNHFGPEGNYIGQYAPQFFTQRHSTPWGAAINFDGRDSRPVRDFFIDNAVYWLSEFRFDGLRLDAVHHLIDDSSPHILAELAATVRPRFPHRHIHLILENEENQASRLVRDDEGRPHQYTAQWNDDVHHVLHTAITREGHGYYGDYIGSDAKLARALAEGFAFQGEVMQCRGTARGEPSAELPPSAFVAFLQNHDQIGNRAFGERLAQLAPPEAVLAASAIYLLLPQTPMLFMGEEWNAREPFTFFCDFSGELARAIREGRRREFAAFPAFRERHENRQIPDPDDVRTFEAAKLDWSAVEQGEGAVWRERYRRLLEIRHRQIVPRIPHIRPGRTRAVRLGTGAVRVTWRVGDDEELELLANLSPNAVAALEPSAGKVLWSENRTREAPGAGWTVCWSLRPG
jgi:malto-oligosyltrehalose trehalohydrolase